MDPTKVVIATPTFYRGGVDDPRFPLALRTVEAARDARHPICVVDGSPDPRVATSFKERGARVFPDLYQGLGPCKRQTIYHAMEIAREVGAQFIAMIEPEKFDMVRLIRRWINSLVNGHTDVVVADRSVESWKSYPTFQVESEGEANIAFTKAIGLTLDIMFGPVAFRIATALDCFLNPFGYLGEGVKDTYIQHFGAVVAHAKGLSVASSHPLNFQYPQEQRIQEEGAQNEEMLKKRAWQRESLIEAYQSLARRYKLPK